jgi:carboxypeptidase Taq
VSQAKFDELRTRLAEIADLVKTASVLGWDQQVMMPPRGAAIRAEQLATVGRIAHQKFTSAETGKLIDDLRGWGEQKEYDSLEASLIRVAAKDWEKASRVPSDLRAEMSRSAALANPVWVEARKNNDFKTFLPVLRKNLDLRKRYIECFEVDDEPYDIVLDDYERGMKTKEVRRIFDYLKEHQAPLVKEVAARGGNESHADGFAIEPPDQWTSCSTPSVSLGTVIPR